MKHVYLYFQTNDKDVPIKEQVKVVKIENYTKDEETDNTENEPLNFKKETKPNAISEAIAMEIVPSISSGENKVMDVSNITTAPSSSTITSTTKVYANLESAMPVSGATAQPPITIQTIEVIIKTCTEFDTYLNCDIYCILH